MDTARLKENFSRVAMHGDEVPLFFYSDLFIKHPETRDLFPISMQAQRDHLVAALVRIVSEVDRLDSLTPFLRGLGRDHRRFGAITGHYEAVAESLLTTLAYFSAESWCPELEADWTAAYQLISSVMIGAAEEDEAQRPAFWRGTVVAAEQRTFDICVLHIRPEPHLEYLPGQSVAIEPANRPRLWRYYSIANAPRPDGTLEFHVRLIDGGAVSMALATGQPAGSRVRLGPPIGVLTLDTSSGKDILMVGGSTGLAPLKALVGQVADLPQPPSVLLVFGARTADDLYDLPALNKMAAEYAWLTVVPSVTKDHRFHRFDGAVGPVPDVVARLGDWSARDAYLAGPSDMVHAVSARLKSDGMPRNQIHVEDFGWSEP